MRALALVGLSLVCLATSGAQDVNWNLGASGDWDNVGAWSPTYPGAGDYVFNNTSFSITHSAGFDQIQAFSGIGSLYMNGGTLSGASTSSSTIQDQGGIIFNGGTLANFSVIDSQLLSFSNSVFSTLSSVALDAGLNLSNGGLVAFSSGLTLGSGSVTTMANGAGFGSLTNQTLDQGTVQFSASGGQQYIGLDGNTTLTLGPELLVQGGNGLVGNNVINGGSTEVNNDGTINANLSGSSIGIVPGALTNNGIIEATNGGFLYTQPSWLNNGTLLANGGSITLDNGLTNAVGASVDVSNGGVIRLAGTLNDNGTILATSPLGSGALQMDGSTIQGGTVVDSQLLVFSNNNYSTLAGVALGNGLNLTNGGVVAFNGNLSLAGTAIMANGAGLGSDSNQTLDQGTVQFSTTGGPQFIGLNGGTTLTLGTNLLVQGGNGLVGTNVFNGGSTAVINDGSIKANVSGASIGIVANALTNNGTIQSTGGGILYTQAEWLNNGSLLSNGGSITLDNGLTNSAGASVDVSNGGVILLGGTLTNNGTILANSPLGSGAFQMDGSTIQGGTVVDSQLLSFSNANFSTLSGVTLGNGLNLTNGGLAGFSGNLILNGAVSMAIGAGLGSESNQSLDRGTIQFSPGGGLQYIGLNGNTTLTLGPNLRVEGGNALVGNNIFNGGSTGVSNDGTIDSNISGASIGIVSSALTNNGTIEATNGGILYTQPSWLNSGTLLSNAGSITVENGMTNAAGASVDVSNGGVILLGGTLANNGTILANSPIGSGAFQMDGSTILGGTVVDSQLLSFSNVNFSGLSGVTLGNGLNLTNGGLAGFGGNLILGGTVSMANGAGLGSTATETLDQGTIQFSLTGGQQYIGLNGNTALTLGPNLLVEGGNALIGNNIFNGGSTEVINDGTIDANISGLTIGLVSSSLTNNGTMEVTNGSILYTQPNWLNNGTLLASGPGSVVVLDNGMTNGPTGSVDVSGGGIIDLGGTLTNNGTILANSPLGSGILTLNGSTILGGTVVDSQLLSFSNVNFSGLSGVTLGNGLNLTNGGLAGFGGNLILGGTVSMANGAGLGSTATETLDQGTIQFSLTGGQQYIGLNGNTALTLGPNLLVEGGNALIGNNIFNGGSTEVINDGTIDANISGAAISLIPSSLTNNGTMEATNGGILSVQPELLNYKKINIGVGSELVAANGILQLSASASTEVKGTLDGAITLGDGIGHDGGLLIGNGVINGSVTNLSGTIRPFDPQILSINGDFFQGANGETDMDIAGNGPAGAPDGFDQIQVQGSLDLGGTIGLIISPAYSGGPVALFTYTGSLDILPGLQLIDLSNPNAPVTMQIGPNGTLDFTAATPEPASLLALLPALAFLSRRRRKSAA